MEQQQQRAQADIANQELRDRTRELSKKVRGTSRMAEEYRKRHALLPDADATLLIVLGGQTSQTGKHAAFRALLTAGASGADAITVFNRIFRAALPSDT